MNDDKPATDFDDTEILEKFHNLLNKYQNQGKIINTLPAVKRSGTDKDGLTDADKIPLLTEAVILHPALIQPQPARLTPIRQILDAALQEAGIAMSMRDRKALATALETRLDHRNQ